MKVALLIALGIISVSTAHQSAWAQKAKDSAGKAEKPKAEAAPSLEAGEAVDVSKITEKYWAQGKETELGVVQNRKFTSSNKFEISLLGGFISSDPFLSVQHYGGSIGYHFNPYLSVHAIGWKASVSDSSAYASFRTETNGTGIINTNEPRAFYGVQTNYNFLYGKASLLGQMIIYVDLFLLGGMGATETQSGTYVTPFVGLGQKIHLANFLALNFDYRLMWYGEDIRSKKPSTLGQKVGERTNTSDAVTIGLSFFY